MVRASSAVATGRIYIVSRAGRILGQTEC